ncbi:MAG TPA: glycosyltransferase family 39 protein [Candidatus Acidoferrales bacterium]|nr:glycosyltransferase family 39 protein [Candidatus Acidoferrales bacterium]
MNRRTFILILLVLSIGIYVGTSGWPPLLDSSDAGHAEAAREMLVNHHWIILHIDGIRYLEKPPLHYWLVAMSYAVFGVGTFATRFPLALAVAGLVMMVYIFARRWFGDRAGFYAGLVMCTSPGVFLFTRIMIPEAILGLELTAAFYLFLRAWQGSLSLRKGNWGAAVMIALAVLTRSLIGIVFPVGIIFFFLWATGNLRKWRKLPLISSAIVFLIVAAPWHIAAGFSGKGFLGGFLWFYFINEQVFRALGWRYPQDFEAVPLWLWLAEHIVWFFPWIAFLPSTIHEIPNWRRWRAGLDERGQALALLTVWTLFILLFFSWTKSRLEYYSFGAWPAIAILLGLGLTRAEEKMARWLPKVQGALAIGGAAIAAILGTMLWISRGIHSTGDISALMQIHPNAFYRLAMSDFMDLTPETFANLRHQAVAAMAIVLVGFLAAWALRKCGRQLAASMTMGIIMAAFFFCANWAFGVFTPRLSSEPLAKLIMKYFKAGDKIALYGEYDAATSIGLYTQKQILLFNGQYNGLEFGSYYQDAPKIFLNDHTFWPVWRGGERVFFIVPPEQTRAALIRMPPKETYLFASLGGKQVFVNHRVTPDEPTLAEVREMELRKAKPQTAEVSK